MLPLLPLLLAARIPAGDAPIDARIFEGKAASDRASFLVVMRQQPDLSGARNLNDRAEKRRFVFETLRAQADAAQAPLRRRLEAGGVPYRSHYLVNMLEIEGDAALARELSARQDVLSIAANRAAGLRLPEPVPPRTAARSGTAIAEANIEKIRAPSLWMQGFTGQGVVVGVADTGFQWDHPALIGRYRGAAASHAYAWHDAIHDASLGNRCGSDAPAPCDDEGHGTGTAGLAVGEGGIGAAPGATLIGCRNMDYGVGTPARYTECFEWLLAPTDENGENPRPDLGADVVNNSWTCPPSEGCTDPDVLESAVENLRAAGVAVVFAAGNDGTAAGGDPACYTVMEPPAIYAAALTVGATWLNDTIAAFSSVGPVAADGSNRMKPDLAAPGVSLRTAAPDNLFASSFTGTSGAAPQVAGAVALLWSALPDLAGDVDHTEQMLELGAAPLRIGLACGGFSGEDVPNPFFGWGRLDVEGAYEVSFPLRDFPEPLHQRPAARLLPPRP